MLYENICGWNVNLYKAGIAIGVIDAVFNLLDVAIDLEFYSEFGSLQMVILSLLSMTILCNILLIHGTLTLNRWLMLYWMSLTLLRILLGLLMIGMIVYLAAHELFLYSFEILETVLLIIGFILVWKLFFKIRERSVNNFNILSEESA